MRAPRPQLRGNLQQPCPWQPFQLPTVAARCQLAHVNLPRRCPAVVPRADEPRDVEQLDALGVCGWVEGEGEEAGGAAVEVAGAEAKLLDRDAQPLGPRGQAICSWDGWVGVVRKCEWCACWLVCCANEVSCFPKHVSACGHDTSPQWIECWERGLKP